MSVIDCEPPIIARSLASVCTAARQPLPSSVGPPSTAEAGMATSVRNTSLKWDSPVIWRNGRTSMPGVVMSTRK